MVRILLALAVGAGVGGVALAHDRENAEAVKVLSARDIKEKLDGKEAKATVVEVTLGPGQDFLVRPEGLRPAAAEID